MNSGTKAALLFSLLLLMAGCGSSGSNSQDEVVAEDNVTDSMPEPEPFLSLEDVGYDDIVVKGSDSRITIYLKSENSASWSNHFLEFNLVHHVNLDKRMNLWRLTKLHDVVPAQPPEPLEFSRQYNGEAIANAGEWECAIIETGAPDFMGGYHGYEELTSYSLAVDGEIISDFDSLELSTAKQLSFTQESDLISQLTGEIAATHVKEYTFTTEHLQIKQTVEWKIETSINYAYLAMLPIKRNLSNSPEVNITDEAYREQTGTYEYIAANDFVPQRTVDEKIRITGTDSGFFGEVTIARNVELPNYSAFVSNASQYNKLYFDFSRSHTTSIGEIWESTSSYNLYVDRVD